jgi:two-component system response regulator CpxR
METMNTNNSKLLLIDDDKELCELLETYLRSEGFLIDCQHDGQLGLEAARDYSYSLIILDVMLPGIDGFEVLKQLRKTSNTPVFMLTARGEDVERILGIEMGADDYLPKPYNPRELLARIRAILKRSGKIRVPVSTEIGGLIINSSTMSALLNGDELPLTSAEFQILDMLAKNAGNVVSREDISRNIFGRELQSFDRSIDVHVSNIRRKMGNTEIIKSIRGSGYIFVFEA